MIVVFLFAPASVTFTGLSVVALQQFIKAPMLFVQNCKNEEFAKNPPKAKFIFNWRRTQDVTSKLHCDHDHMKHKRTL